MSQTQSIKPIEELDSIRANDIPDWVFSSTEPLILRGLVREWPLVELGLDSPLKQLDVLREHYTGKPAYAYYGEDKDVRLLSLDNTGTALNFEMRNASLDGLLTDLEYGLSQPEEAMPVRYIASNIVDFYFPGLSELNKLNFESEHFKASPLEGGDPLVGIWVGNQTVTACHYDAQDNIACCVAGERKFTLFPPSQIENLYPGPLHINPGGQAITMVDFDQPDFDRFPKFEEALKHKYEVVLKPGDALFIPVMWWHQVASLSPFNVLINYWWNSFPKSQGQAMAALEHALLSIRHRPRQEKEAWKAIFDYYVFGDTHTAIDHLPESTYGPLELSDDGQVRQLRARILNKLNR